MADNKWLLFVLLTVVITISCMTIYLTNINKNQGDTIRRIIFKDPFEYTVTKFLEREGVGSNGKIAIELSALDKKIIIILNLARNYEMPLALIAEPETSAASSDHLRREQPSLDSEMSIVQKDTRQETIPFPRTSILPEEGTLNPRVKRELKTDSEINATTFPLTTQLTNLTDRVVEEPTILQTTPMEDQSTPSSRPVREALTPSTEAQEVTSDGQAEIETSTPPSQATLLPESTTASARIPRNTSPKLGLSKQQKTNIKSNQRALRALSKSVTETTVSQEITTPKGEDDGELSTLDLNLIFQTSPRIVRDVPIIQESLNQKVTRPSGRFFREILTQDRMNVKEDGGITSIHKKPIFREKMFMEGFAKERLSAVMDELEQVKLHAMKRISNLEDDPTFPPPTDPEGIEF